MDFAAALIIAVLAFFGLRMVFRDIRRARDDVKDLAKNPTPIKILATMWTLIFIVAIVYTFASTKSTGSLLVVVAAYFGVLFDLGWSYRKQGNRTTVGDVLMNVMFAVFCIPFGLYFLGHASTLWGVIGWAGLAASLFLGGYIDTYLEDKKLG